ncbi:uncharacterized protein LOC144576934 isoform X1 [Callithrix jacchus]
MLVGTGAWIPEDGARESLLLLTALVLMGPPLPVPGLCPPPLRAPHSPGRRRKSTLRRPPRALPAREAPGPLPGEASRLRSRRVSSRHLAPRAPVRPVYARRHGNAAARLGDRPNRLYFLPGVEAAGDPHQKQMLMPCVLYNLQNREPNKPLFWISYPASGASATEAQWIMRHKI